MKVRFIGSAQGFAQSLWLSRVLVLCVFAGLSGCSMGPRSSGAVEQKGREAIVLDRAQARWDALLKDEMPEVYKYFSGASRSVMSYEDFIRSVRLGFWKEARVSKVECDSEDACEAFVEIAYVHKGNLIKTPIRETWIRTEGNWWYVQKS